MPDHLPLASKMYRYRAIVSTSFQCNLQKSPRKRQES